MVARDRNFESAFFLSTKKDYKFYSTTKNILFFSGKIILDKKNSCKAAQVATRSFVLHEQGCDTTTEQRFGQKKYFAWQSPQHKKVVCAIFQWVFFVHHEYSNLFKERKVKATQFPVPTMLWNSQGKHYGDRKLAEDSQSQEVATLEVYGPCFFSSSQTQQYFDKNITITCFLFSICSGTHRANIVEKINSRYFKNWGFRWLCMLMRNTFLSTYIIRHQHI